MMAFKWWKQRMVRNVLFLNNGQTDASLSSFMALSLRFPSFANPNRNRILLRTHSRTLSFIANSKSSPPKVDPSANTENTTATTTSSPPSPSPEKKSFAEATGELFLGLASRIIKSRSRSLIGDSGNVAMFENPAAEKGKISEEGIGAVVKDEIEPDVVWEQRVKDVEAERKRPVVTSPGFSFSAAGLLFPYHLGVSQFLIEKGYIKVKFIFGFHLLVVWLFFGYIELESLFLRSAPFFSAL